MEERPLFIDPDTIEFARIDSVPNGEMVEALVNWAEAQLPKTPEEAARRNKDEVSYNKFIEMRAAFDTDPDAESDYGKALQFYTDLRRARRIKTVKACQSRELWFELIECTESWHDEHDRLQKIPNLEHRVIARVPDEVLASCKFAKGVHVKDLQHALGMALVQFGGWSPSNLKK